MGLKFIFIFKVFTIFPNTSVKSNQGYEIDMYCFSAKHAELRSKSKDWLAWNQYNVSEWSNVSFLHRLLFQWTSTKNPTNRVDLVQIRDIIIISSRSRDDIAEQLLTKQATLNHYKIQLIIVSHNNRLFTYSPIQFISSNIQKHLLFFFTFTIM